MFWWIVLAVVVVGFALAWWASGRAKGKVPPGDRATAEGEALDKYGPATGRGGNLPGGAA